MIEDCLFCKIAKKEIPARIVDETDDWLCFEDISPKAPMHYLIIPKQHQANLHSVDSMNVYSEIFAGIKKIVINAGVEKSGYRVVANTGADGGQSVNHLHFHILAKRPLGWPPG